MNRKRVLFMIEVLLVVIIFASLTGIVALQKRAKGTTTTSTVEKTARYDGVSPAIKNAAFMYLAGQAISTSNSEQDLALRDSQRGRLIMLMNAQYVDRRIEVVLGSSYEKVLILDYPELTFRFIEKK